MIAVIDTNVPIVANGHSEQASNACVISCAQKVSEIMSPGNKLLLDDRWLIISEYQQNLHPLGQPGVGDAFLKWVLTNQANTNRCALVQITPRDDELMFEEFPEDPDLNAFDPSDRKFVAVACAYFSAHSENPPILDAVDTDWWHHRQALNNNNVIIEFICLDDIQRLANE